MTNIIPIKGLRFTPKAGSDYSRIITQPYDVISPEGQDKYYEKSPFNIIRLEYAKSLPGDSNSNNKYTRAAHTLQEWITEGILCREEKPALYLYEQHFPLGGKICLRKGIFCGVELTPFEDGNIIPHEKTMDKPKTDRLQLLNHCETNFSPVFGLYSDSNGYMDDLAGTLKKDEPIIDFSDDEGQTHRIWAITESDRVAEIKDFFRDKKIFIADGHHRYETALQFYRQKSKGLGDPGKHRHVLMALVNIYDDGLLSFPTHRLVINNDVDTASLLSRLQTNFAVQELANPGDKEQFLTVLEGFLSTAKEDEVTLGLYTAEGKLYGLKLINSEHYTFPLLDTFVLQELILGAVFNLGAEGGEQPDLIYLKDEWEAKNFVDNNKGRYVFYLNRPSVERIIELAEKGIRMPQKTTYFYPKMITGLIMLKH